MPSVLPPQQHSWGFSAIVNKYGTGIQSTFDVLIQVLGAVTDLSWATRGPPDGVHADNVHFKVFSFVPSIHEYSRGLKHKYCTDSVASTVQQ